ncbi:DUF4321 domain-containing protein [Paenibacillus thermoaerophilus]|jgi:hypothetical protein|uniref:DUF4321 domain-containing protein n=1 Tax=Paenibacillus thermoaerophilus TaxID=1215385 RepID=A0ABW2V310_9BACL|nr:DUF4321 domain-containing protein [Paenibacillus thermoaerophilus]TMV11111.1 DUF4321 domain-containing protein [Paenibacillus thermoaerophilus]
MKKNTFTLIVFLLLGLLAGMIAGELLSPVPGLKFLTTAADIEWHPKADLEIVQYDFFIRLKLNLIAIVGLIAAIWIYRKL